MLGHFFYIIGLILLIVNISTLVNYNKIFNTTLWIDKFRKVSGRSPEISDFRSKTESDLYFNYNSSIVLNFIWFVLGIITNSWYIFLGIIAMGYIIKTISNIINIDVVKKYLGFSFQLVKVIIIFALIINHFHFHINWIDLL